MTNNSSKNNFSLSETNSKPDSDYDAESEGMTEEAFCLHQFNKKNRKANEAFENFLLERKHLLTELFFFTEVSKKIPETVGCEEPSKNDSPLII